uniref:Uncharacterized protein n=1 Tax=Anguilla anguilla TaxID=7936 RepID=A0A0E9WUT9_ANGAN
MYIMMFVCSLGFSLQKHFGVTMKYNALRDSYIRLKNDKHNLAQKYKICMFLYQEKGARLLKHPCIYKNKLIFC